MNKFQRWVLGATALSLPLLAMASDQAASASEQTRSAWSKKGSSPLVDKVRQATARFRDINVAIGEGWAPATPCVSGPNAGAMGVHFVLPARVGDGAVKGNEPEALIYEPLSNGAMRLVGVEFIVVAADWATILAAAPRSTDI